MRNLKLEYRSKAGGHRLFGIEPSRARDVVGTLCQPQHLPAFDGAIIAGQVGYIAEVICAHSGVLANAKIKHKRYRQAIKFLKLHGVSWKSGNGFYGANLQLTRYGNLGGSRAASVSWGRANHRRLGDDNSQM